MYKTVAITALILLVSCKENPKNTAVPDHSSDIGKTSHATGFRIEKMPSGVTYLEVSSPWPGAESGFTYALVPKELLPVISLDAGEFDAIVGTPVNSLVVTSTTHIPALEALGMLDRLVGFPGTRYISSPEARARIESGKITELGSNEAINTERIMEMQPEVLIGFGIDNQNRAYNILQRSQIPVVYNGEWTEETPLGKAEWIKFFAAFFGLEKKADSIFSTIVDSYVSARELAKKAKYRPTVLSGALYKDVWYLPGGNSWATQLLEDANAAYLWKDNDDTGSLSLSVENVLDTAREADFWVSPSQYTTYEEMERANGHYLEIRAFRNKKVFTFARTKGATGGLLYYELAPNRPELVLRDLIHIFHPELLPDHQPFFYKPLL